jgi:hypothetical protein
VALNNGGQATVQVPLNATCAPTEPNLPPPPAYPGMTCTWDPPFIQPPAPFTISIGGPASAIVTNPLKCVRP